MALSGFASQSNATYPTLESMLDNFAPIAPNRAPELNQLIIRLNALAPYPQLQQDALLTLVPLADGSLRAAIDGPLRQVNSVIGERLLLVDMNEETGYAAGDEPPTAKTSESTAKDPKPADNTVKVEAGKAKAVKVSGTKAVKTDEVKTEVVKESKTKTEVTTKVGGAQKTEVKKEKTVTKTEKTDEVKTVDTKAEKTAEKKTSETTVTKEKSEKVDETVKTEDASKTTDATSIDSSTIAASSSSSKDKIPDLSKAKKINGVWGQLLGDHIKQDERSAIPGYRADVLGGVIGRDLYLAPLVTVGVAGGYQHARVTQSYLSGSYLSVDRYQGTAYGRYHFCEWPIYILGAVTLAANDYENDRYILVPPTGALTQYSVIANSRFTGWEADIYLENGFVWKCGNFRAVPKIMLTYSRLNFDSYYESDAAFLDLTVKYDSMDQFTLGVGGKFDYRNRFEKAYVVPEFHAYYFYDFMNDAQVATAEFFSGGYAFLSQGPAPSPNTVEVGAALSVHSYRNVVVKVQYDYTTRSDYHRHGAFIKVRYEWA